MYIIFLFEQWRLFCAFVKITTNGVAALMFEYLLEQFTDPNILSDILEIFFY